MDEHKKGGHVPELRFPGFSGDWEEKKFSELYVRNNKKNDLSFSTDKIISVANMFYNPDITVSDVLYLKSYNIFRKGDIAYEGNKNANHAFGRFVENTIGDGIVSHVFNVYSPISKDHCIEYWKYAINYERIMKPILERCTIKTTMMHSLVDKDFMKQIILVPPTLAEQQKIAECLTALDETISAAQQWLDALREKKKGLMQQLFPEEGARTPRLRFPGFSGDWEEKKFSELYVRNNKKNDLSFSTDKIISVANMFYNPDITVSDVLYLKSYNIFRKGDIAYEGNKNANHAFGRFAENTIGDGIVSHVFNVYSPINKDHCIEYWKYAINYERIMKPILERCTIKTTMMHSLVDKDFMKQIILVPPTLAEQQKIAECLTALDETINAAQQRLSALKAHKKGLMQKLFPKPDKQ